MLTLIVGLGFILLGIVPYGYLSFSLLKEPKELEADASKNKNGIWVQSDRLTIQPDNCSTFLSWLTLSLNYFLLNNPIQNTRTSSQKYSYLTPRKIYLTHYS